MHGLISTDIFRPPRMVSNERSTSVNADKNMNPKPYTRPPYRDRTPQPR